MSAFIVSKAHIDALVKLAVVHDVGWYDGGAMRYARHDPDGVGLMLLTENVRSVQCRYAGGLAVEREDNPDEDTPYEDTPLDQLPGPVSAYWTKPYAYESVGLEPTPVQGLKMVDCYVYQSCEHLGWKESSAHHFCEALKDALISALPGYEEAPWEWDGEGGKR